MQILMQICRVTGLVVLPVFLAPDLYLDYIAVARPMSMFHPPGCRRSA